MEKREYRNMENLDQSHFWFLGVTRIIISILDRYYKNSKDLEVLDAGSGTCWLSVPLQKYGNVTALDIERSVLNVCKERGVNEVIEADIQNIPIKDNRFDVIVCSEVLYHLYVKDDQLAVKEFYRILKPGGRLLVKVPAHSYLSGEHDRVNLTRKRYEKHEVDELFKMAGFNVDLLTYAMFFLFPLVFLKRKLERKTKSSESDVRKLNPMVNFIMLSILKIEAKLLSKIRLPQGSSIICVGYKPIS